MDVSTSPFHCRVLLRVASEHLFFSARSLDPPLSLVWMMPCYQVHGFVGWFDVQLAPDVWLTTVDAGLPCSRSEPRLEWAED